jgi:hypothetical protein
MTTRLIEVKQEINCLLKQRRSDSADAISANCLIGFLQGFALEIFVLVAAVL